MNTCSRELAPFQQGPMPSTLLPRRTAVQPPHLVGNHGHAILCVHRLVAVNDTHVAPWLAEAAVDRVQHRLLQQHLGSAGSSKVVVGMLSQQAGPHNTFAAATARSTGCATKQSFYPVYMLRSRAVCAIKGSST